MTPLDSDRQALVVDAVPDARRLALYYLRGRPHLNHLREELLSHAYEGLVQAASTWRPELGTWRGWFPRVVWTQMVHLSRRANTFSVSPKAWRAGSRPPSTVHLGAALPGQESLTVESTLVCPRPLPSEVLAGRDLQAVRAYLLVRARARAPARPTLRPLTPPEVLVGRWWRVRVEGAELEDVGRLEGISRQAVQQSVARLDAWVEEWAASERRAA